MPKILITEFMEESAVQWLKDHAQVTYEPDLHRDIPALMKQARHADALIVRNRTQVDTALLTVAEHVRVVGRLGVGLENIDQEACRSRQISVIPAIGANAAAVAEYVIFSAMLLLRRATVASPAVTNGQWPRDHMAGGREIGGKLLGIVGLGSVGRCTAELAKRVGMHISAYDPTVNDNDGAWSQARRFTHLDTLLMTADVVSLHVPLTDTTKNLIDSHRIGLMRPESILINVSRGGVVDESALANALRAGRLAGAALDVFTQEPLPGHSILSDVPNLFLTPHIAGVTHESNIRVSAMIARAVVAALPTR